MPDSVIDDRELHALTLMIQAMNDAPAEARGRILAYLIARFEIDAGDL